MRKTDLIVLGTWLGVGLLALVLVDARRKEVERVRDDRRSDE